MMELEPEGHNPLLVQPTEGRNTKIDKLRRKNEVQKNEIHKLRIELTKLKKHTKPPFRWIPRSERSPTNHDDETGFNEIWALCRSGLVERRPIRWFLEHPDESTHWAPIIRPEPPRKP